MSTSVGSVELINPVMTASGTSGHGNELGAYFDLAEIGAVTVKSLAHYPWPGNSPLRVTPAAAGMLNSVGLAGPGVAAWTRDYLPGLATSQARVVVSIWGRNYDDFARTALEVDKAANADPSRSIIAVEVNVSCPNLEDSRNMFAHSARATSQVTAAVSRATSLPVWVKLSPNTPDVIDIAGAALESGAQSLTLVNTLLGMAIDIGTRAPKLGGVTGGLSGPALAPVALRWVYECRKAYPGTPIVGVGGVNNAEAAIALLMAGANAVQVGTASFVDPSAPMTILKEMEKWCVENGVAAVGELMGVAQNK